MLGGFIVHAHVKGGKIVVLRLPPQRWAWADRARTRAVWLASIGAIRQGTRTPTSRTQLGIASGRWKVSRGLRKRQDAPPRSLSSSCTDGCHYAGTPLFGCRIRVPPKSPLLLVQGSSHASCAMCCVYAPFVCIYSSNVDTTSRFTRTSSPHKLFVNRDC